MPNLSKFLGNMYVWTGGGTDEVLRFEYNFANDGGAISLLAGFKAKQKMLVKKAVMKVKTTCASDGSATVSIGKTGSVAAFTGATAVASLVADAIITGVAGLGAGGVIIAVDDEVGFDIAVAALTAGKLEAELTVSKF